MTTHVDRGASLPRRFVAQWRSRRSVCHVLLAIGDTAEAARESAVLRLRHSGTPDGPFLWGRGRICVMPLARAVATRRRPAPANP